jgi:transcriptional regulator with XRE-family HTH domain
MQSNELAERVGTGPSSVSNWLNGVNPPKGKHLRKLAEALKCDPSEFFDASDASDASDSSALRESPRDTRPDYQRLIELFSAEELVKKAVECLQDETVAALDRGVKAKPLVDELDRRRGMDDARPRLKVLRVNSVGPDPASPEGGLPAGTTAALKALEPKSGADAPTLKTSPPAPSGRKHLALPQ